MYLLPQNSLGWRGDNLLLQNENWETEMKQETFPWWNKEPRWDFLNTHLAATAASVQHSTSEKTIRISFPVAAPTADLL